MRTWRALLAAGCLLVGAGCAGAPGSGAGSVADAPVPAATSAAPTSKAPAKAKASGPQPIPSAAAVTVTDVSIASIDLRSGSLEKLGLGSDGSLAAPHDPDRAGWYSAGTVPGAVGPAVIAGHVDSTTGPAVFYDLSRVKRGAAVTVTLSNHHTARFTVDRVVTTPKKGFPTDEVFGPTPDAQLRLITCGGPYDRSVGGYQDNTIVFATAVG